MGMVCVDLTYSQTVEDRMIGDVFSHALQQTGNRVAAPFTATERSPVDRKFRTEWVSGYARKRRWIGNARGKPENRTAQPFPYRLVGRRGDRD